LANFGGVPQVLLFDQMRAVVIGDDRMSKGALVMNAEFLRFAAHSGFRPRACRSYRAKTKGRFGKHLSKNQTPPAECAYSTAYQSLPVPIDLTEGQLAHDLRTEILACLALLQEQVLHKTELG
jgi:hypothetical protein